MGACTADVLDPEKTNQGFSRCWHNDVPFPGKTDFLDEVWKAWCARCAHLSAETLLSGRTHTYTLTLTHTLVVSGGV